MVMKLGELAEHEQYEVCKAVLDGLPARINGEQIELPNSLSVRYTCVNHECKRLLTPSYYISDMMNIPNRVRCPTCGHWATRHFIGTTVDLAKEITKKVQKRMTDYNQP
jgi:DNA-directed RNA polymerase subunit RPC12/RpoP